MRRFSTQALSFFQYVFRYGYKHLHKINKSIWRYKFSTNNKLFIAVAISQSTMPNAQISVSRRTFQYVITHQIKYNSDERNDAYTGQYHSNNIHSLHFGRYFLIVGYNRRTYLTGDFLGSGGNPRFCNSSDIVDHTERSIKVIYGIFDLINCSSVLGFTVERTDVKIVVRRTVGEESVVIASNAIASCDLKVVLVLDREAVVSCGDFVVIVVVVAVVKALVTAVVAVVAAVAAGIDAAVLVVIVLAALLIVTEGIVEVGEALLMLKPAVKGKVDILASYRLLLVNGGTVISSSSPKTVIIKGVEDGLSNLFIPVVVFAVVGAAVVFVVFSFFIVIGSKVTFENTVGVVCLIVSFRFEALLGLDSAVGVLAIRRLKLTAPLMLYLNLARLLSTADKVEVDGTFNGVVVTVVGGFGNSFATDTSSNLGCSSLTEVMVKALGLRGELSFKVFMDVLLIANVELPTLEKFAHWRIQLAVVRRVKFFVQLRIQTDRGSVGVREVVSTAVAVRLVVITRDLTPVRCKALRLAARTFIKRRSRS
uniref:Uncharacterized protein n=1 Tax=Glossina palpalis gambiensis TaxID=67801 RepID=A0A1B0B7U7_9MUSC